MSWHSSTTRMHITRSNITWMQGSRKAWTRRDHSPGSFIESYQIPKLSDNVHRLDSDIFGPNCCGWSQYLWNRMRKILFDDVQWSITYAEGLLAFLLFLIPFLAWLWCLLGTTQSVPIHVRLVVDTVRRAALPRNLFICMTKLFRCKFSYCILSSNALVVQNLMCIHAAD